MGTAPILQMGKVRYGAPGLSGVVCSLGLLPDDRPFFWQNKAKDTKIEHWYPKPRKEDISSSLQRKQSRTERTLLYKIPWT